MGRTTTPKYVVDVFTRNLKGTVRKDTMSWSGKISTLEAWVIKYGKSFEAGNVNAHISESCGFIPYPNRAEIRHNCTNGNVVASWKAPMFFAW